MSHFSGTHPWPASADANTMVPIARPMSFRMTESLLGVRNQGLRTALRGARHFQRGLAERLGRRKHVVVLRLHPRWATRLPLEHFHPHLHVPSQPDRHL